MVPRLPASERGANQSESDFWLALREELADDFYVVHGLEFLTENAQEGEVDFLIFHRELGMLNVECKGWGVERDHKGEWWRKNPNTRQREHLNKTPTSQAKDQIREIVKLLAPMARDIQPFFGGQFPLVFGWALAFPYATRAKVNVPTSLQKEIVLDSSDLGNLDARVREAFEFYNERHAGNAETWTKDQLETFIWDKVMHPWPADPRLAGRLRFERKELVKLSNEQHNTVNAIVANDRVAVSGGAGTGKTVVAMEAARRLAEDGKSVLVTCFNSGLATQLQRVRSRWDDMPGSVHVNNFHAICVDAAPKGSLEFPKPGATAEEQRDFWARQAPMSLWEVLAADGYEHGPWDAVIVDEAQDFYEEWWPILDEGMTDNGKLAVFYDARQSIFEHGSPVPTDGMAKQPLTINFRNTKEICEVVAELGDINLRPHHACPAGEPPTVYQQQRDSKTRRMVDDLVRRLIEREDLDYSQVAILTPHSPKNSTMEAATEAGGQPIVHDTEDWMKGEGVLHTTISAFKGMEADTVIMLDVDPDDERCTRDHRYVAASRAKHRLHVFEKNGHWME